jgi:hypothetical protein
LLILFAVVGSNQIWSTLTETNKEQVIEQLAKLYRENHAGIPLADYFANSDLARAFVEGAFGRYVLIRIVTKEILYGWC